MGELFNGIGAVASEVFLGSALRSLAERVGWALLAKHKDAVKALETGRVAGIRPP
jgi:hypothetical protein